MRNEKPNSERVMSRPGPICYLVSPLVLIAITICAVLAWLPPSSPEQRAHPLTEPEKWAITSICSLLAVLVVAATVYYRRCWCVVAEKGGLRWQKWGKWKSATWDEVTDYRIGSRQARQSGLSWECVIETATQTVKFPSKDWTNGEAMQAFVKSHATHSFSKEWGQIGERDRERFPFTFLYDTKDNRSLRFLPLLVWFAIPAVNVLVISDKWDKNPNLFQMSDLPWTLANLGMLNLLLSVHCLMAWMIHRQYRENKKRFSQKITATEEGLTYEDGRDRISLAWEKILVCWKEPKGTPTRYTVQGVNAEFDFILSVSQFPILLRLLKKRAPDAMKRGREFTPDEEDLLPDRWDATPGVHVYHYRTRSTRILLLFPMIIAPLMLSMRPLLHFANDEAVLQSNALEWLGGGLLLLIPYLWWRYFAGKVVTDSGGVTHYTPFGKHSLAWGDILEVKRISSKGDLFSCFVLVGQESRLRFSLYCNRPDDLLEEINRRSVHRVRQDAPAEGV